MGQVISTLTALPGGVFDTHFLGNIQRRKRIMLAVQLVGIPVAAVYLFRIDFTVVIMLNVSATKAYSHSRISPQQSVCIRLFIYSRLNVYDQGRKKQKI